jgi:hypothetical protein
MTRRRDPAKPPAAMHVVRPPAEPTPSHMRPRPLGDVRVALWGLALILIILAACLFLSKG